MGALGGIGFTVSLLMNELAFAGHEGVADQGTLAVLLGSGAAIVLSAVVVSRRSRAVPTARREGRRRRRVLALRAASIGCRRLRSVRGDRLLFLAEWGHLSTAAAPARATRRAPHAVADASAAASGTGKIAVTSFETQAMSSPSSGISPPGIGNGTRMTSFCAKCFAPG